jgi:hypothetical protein
MPWRFDALRANAKFKMQKAKLNGGRLLVNFEF